MHTRLGLLSHHTRFPFLTIEDFDPRAATSSSGSRSLWFEVVGNAPGQFAKFLKTEYERWDRLVKLSGVKVE